VSTKKKTENGKEVTLKDRNWNWKDDYFKYAKSRAKAQPGYVGSYAMDAMAMALHCVWSTNSFTEALLKCANTRGDSDSVCAVAGQIAGAIYGLKSIPKDWVQAVLTWDKNHFIPLRAYKLYKHHPVVFKRNEAQLQTTMLEDVVQQADHNVSQPVVISQPVVVSQPNDGGSDQYDTDKMKE